MLGNMVSLKSEREIKLMREAGRMVGQVLYELTAKVVPGVSTGELDAFAEQRCKDFGVIPAFKGYHGFPASLCISINDEIVHGIPSPKRKLKDGDIVGMDFGVIYEGFFGDSARTYGVGEISDEAKQLLDVTEKSLHLGIEQARVGNRLFDIGHAVQNYVEGFGYGVVREFVGHGIGKALHEDPQVPNYGPKGKGMVLKEGLVIHFVERFQQVVDLVFASSHAD